jgi:hypothetical protein
MLYIKPKIITSYRTTGVYLCCGSYNHWLSDCPKLARPNSWLNTQLASTGKKVTIIAIDNDSYSRWDSDSTGSID